MGEGGQSWADEGVRAIGTGHTRSVRPAADDPFLRSGVGRQGCPPDEEGDLWVSSGSTHPTPGNQKTEYRFQSTAQVASLVKGAIAFRIATPIAAPRPPLLSASMKPGALG